MAGHTPGPWTAEQWKAPQKSWGHGWSIRPHRPEDGGMTGFQLAAIEGDDTVASATSMGGSAEANAHLIAASPDLLEACKKLLRVIEKEASCYLAWHVGCHCWKCDLRRDASAAIKKAEGGK